MKARGVVVALGICLLAAGTAGGSAFRVAQLRRESRWLLARGNAQAEASIRAEDGSLAMSQKQTFERRRHTLEASHLWHRVEMLSILISVSAAFCAYVLHLLRRLHAQLVEGDALEPDEAANP